MKALFVLVVGLGMPGILPALAVARRSPAVAFLAPLIGAGMAAVAAEIEFGIGGSLLTNYVVVAVTANLAIIAWWLAAGRSRQPWAGVPWRWYVSTVVVVLGSAAIPLTALRSPMIGWDANSIWLTHALMVSGGHHEMLTGLQNVTYRFSNPDYPPLVPAAGALAFAFLGLGDLHRAVDMTVLLSACALGVVGTGIAAAGSGGRQLTRMAAVAAGGSICLVGFAVSDIFGIEGYTDLLWAAAAAGAVIWGLVLPRSTQAVGIAWICAAVASLTKNEGLTTALIVLVLIAVRYRPLTLPGPPPPDPSLRRVNGRHGCGPSAPRSWWCPPCPDSRGRRWLVSWAFRTLSSGRPRRNHRSFEPEPPSAAWLRILPWLLSISRCSWSGAGSCAATGSVPASGIRRGCG